MPYTIFQKIGVGELKPTRMTLQLADTSVRLPLGIVEDVPVQVGNFFVPGDFVVMDMEEDREVPIILGRPFLRTARTVFDTYEGTLTMNVGGEKVKFQVTEAMKYPDLPNHCYRIDIFDELVEEVQQNLYEEQEQERLAKYYSDIQTDNDEALEAAFELQSSNEAKNEIPNQQLSTNNWNSLKV